MKDRTCQCYVAYNPIQHYVNVGTTLLCNNSYFQVSVQYLTCRTMNFTSVHLTEIINNINKHKHESIISGRMTFFEYHCGKQVSSYCCTLKPE